MKRFTVVAAVALAACTQQPADPLAQDREACINARGPDRVTACDAVIDNAGQAIADRVGALNMRANAKREAGDVTGAMRDYQAALALDDANTFALIGRGRILLESGQLDAAQPLLERAAEADETGEADTLLGRIALAQSDYSAAVARFNAALAHDPRLAPALAGRARAKQRQDDLAGARSDYDAAIRANANLAEARAGRCWLTLLQDDGADLDQARMDARAAVAADPRLIEGQICRGVLALRDAQWVDARTAFDAVLAIEPGNPTALFGRGVARRRAGDRGGTQDMNLARDFDRNIGGRFDDLGVRTY